MAKTKVKEAPAALQILSDLEEANDYIAYVAWDLADDPTIGEMFNTYNRRFSALYVDEEGDVWNGNFYIRFDYRRYASYVPCQITQEGSWEILKNGRIGKIKNARLIPLNKEEEIWEAVENTNPYLKKWLMEKYPNSRSRKVASLLTLAAPQLEILSKAGYEFANIILDGRAVPQALQAFDRLTKPGKSPKEIFKTTKIVYDGLKKETDLTFWDVVRKINKKNPLSKEAIDEISGGTYRTDELNLAQSVLNKVYDGKPVFTWETLIRYLNRIDMYEAIDKLEGLTILSDYLRMCCSKELNIKPKIDGDSLKREHDIAARMFRQIKIQGLETDIKEQGEKLSRLKYEEGLYFIRPIESYDDLIDEAKQQRNCLACYARGVAEGNDKVFVMRRKDNPTKSLVTIQLSYDETYIRQAYLACNRPIESRSMSKVLDNWLENIQVLNAA